MGGGPSRDMQQMKSREWNGAGKTAIVTGPMGNGIGFHTSRWLAERGCHVVLAGRSADRLLECEKQIRAASKAADGSPLPADQIKLTSIVLDLSSLDSVENFAKEYKQLNLPLNLLMNNAGVADTPYSHTKDNIEMQMGTNHLGHFYLTQLLEDKLIEGAPARVVCVASMAYKMAPMTVDSMSTQSLFHPAKENYSGWKIYGNSKLSNILFARSLNNKLQEKGVTAYSLHPGLVATDIGRQNKLNAFFWKVGSCALKTAEEGAGTSIHCATHPDAIKDAGAYFDVCAPSKKTAAKATDDALAEKLWKITQDELDAWKAKPKEAQAPAAAAAAEEQKQSA